MKDKINLFILGAPKCGTTALYEILKKHDDIYFPEFKEPHFFADDLGLYQAHKTKEEFFSIYDGRGQEKIIGDASIFHLFSSVGAENINNYNSTAKYIVMLRDPVVAVPSYHSQLVYTQDESIKNCERAWDLSAERSRNKNVPIFCKSNKVLDYKSMFAYGTQIEKLYGIIDRSRILIIFNDEMVDQYDALMKKISHFLEVKENKIKNKLVNPNQKNRIDYISKFLRHPPPPVKKVKRLIMGRGRNKIYDWIIEVNTKSVRREAESNVFLKKIFDHYLTEIEKLEHLSGVNLEGWKSVWK